MWFFIIQQELHFVILKNQKAAVSVAVSFHCLIDSAHVQACAHGICKKLVLPLPIGGTRLRNGITDGYAFARSEPEGKPVDGFRTVKNAVKIGAENKAFRCSVFPAVGKTAEGHGCPV